MKIYLACELLLLVSYIVLRPGQPITVDVCAYLSYVLCQMSEMRLVMCKVCTFIDLVASTRPKSIINFHSASSLNKPDPVL